MVKAGVRYTRIPDPDHVLSIRGRARGEELKADYHRMRCPNKNVCSPIWFLISLTRWGQLKKKLKRFVHSFISGITKKSCGTV